ncbi:MAG: hypothetical protein P4L16_06260 [Chlamydiales bacterium]|nr:hypothetical protein [Chlamydiales bacterium]
MLKIILIVLGLIISCIGIAGFIFPEISYDAQKSLFEIGPWNAKLDVTHIVHIPRMFSGASLGLGLLILIFASLKKSK